MPIHQTGISTAKQGSMSHSMSCSVSFLNTVKNTEFSCNLSAMSGAT
jgi:hypothetical protein